MITSSDHRAERTATGDPDSVLGALIDDLADRLQAGQAVDLEACVREHPEHESQIRGLFPALEMMAALGRSADRGAGGPPPPGNDPRLGSGVLGDYRIVREVGRGGMGVVFEAMQISLGRRVALKILPLAAAVDPRHLQRFQLEAQAAAHLHHPHIVPIHAVGCDRGVHYYAMQFVEGRSLADLVREIRRGAAKPPDADFELAGDRPAGRPADADPTASEPSPTAEAPKEPSGSSRSSRDLAPARSAARLGIQAAEALEHAHGLGVLHRDIKPANLLVESSGHLWVADFGLARFGADSDLTRTGDLLGTLRYMSPEQVAARRVVVDHRTDIYSLGATLYELLTARPAFDGQDRQELLRRIASEDPTPPRQLDPTIPRDLETIVLKAMAKEPEGRYATALDLAEDLRRFLADEPIRARRPGPAERLAKWAKRHRVALASAAAALVIAMAVGSALLWHQHGQTIREKERTWRAYEQNRKILDLVFSKQEQVNMKAMGLITQANMKGLGDDGAYVGMVRDFYQDMIKQAGDDPDTAELKARSYHLVGFCRMVLGDIAGAEEAYRRAVELFEELLARGGDSPSMAWLLASTLNDRGQLLWIVGDRPGLDPGQAAARKSQSEADYRRATTLRREAMTRLTPDAMELGSLASAQLELAGHLDEDGRHAEAEAVRKQLIEFYRVIVPTLPNQPGKRRVYGAVHSNLGADWFLTPHRRNAEVMLELARQRDPDGPVTLNNTAWGLARRPNSPPGDLARALGLATKVVEETPTDGAVWNTLGVVRYRMGDWKGSVEAFETSMRLRDGGDANDWYFLAMAHQRLGDPEGARKWFEKAGAWVKEKAPDNEELKRFRSEAEALLKPGPAGS